MLLLLKPTLPYRGLHPTFMGLIERNSETKPMADILDRIFDKGIVVDGGSRLLLTEKETRIRSSGNRGQVASLDRPSLRDERWHWIEVQPKSRAA